MSRVFDALQEAARHRGTNGAPTEAVWTELGIDSKAAPVSKVERETTAVAAVSAGPQTLPTNVILEAIAAAEASEAEDGSASEAGLLGGAPERIHLDKQARLIPHTTDRIVVERYRMLRTKILQEREKKFFRSLVV